MSVLKLATYNVHGGRGLDRVRDYKRIGDYMGQVGLDIILLQEVDTRPSKQDTVRDIADLCGDYPHFLGAPTMATPEGWYGNAILSRYPIIDRVIVDISAPGREPRNLIDAYIETPYGLLRVMNAHKGLKGSERHYQLGLIHEQLERIHHELEENPSIPLVFGGDINEWRPYFSVTSMLDRTLQPHRVGATWPAFRPVFHLDRVWCRPAGLIKKAWVLRSDETRRYSDHLPVVAEIRDLKG